MQPTIAILTALAKEHAAVKLLLEDARPMSVPGDPTRYLVGNIPGEGGPHAVILAVLTKMANNPAAVTTTNVIRSFPSVHDVIFCGIAAGMPRPDKPGAHVRLGDVIVSSGRGVVQFDLGAATPEGFEVRDTSPPPSARLLQAVNILESEMLTEDFAWDAHVAASLSKAGIRRPHREPRRDFDHPPDPLRKPGVPKIYYGKIGASNTLMKDADRRSIIAKALGLFAMEMEGSGLADATWEAARGYLVIRSSCDYGDPNKEDAWQTYAAHVSAAYLQALLKYLAPYYPVATGLSLSGGRTLSVPSGSFPEPERILSHNANVWTLSQQRLTCCVWLPDGRELYAAGFDGNAYLRSIQAVEAQAVTVPRLAKASDAIIRTIHFHQERDMLLAGDDDGKLIALRNDLDALHVAGETATAIYSLSGSDSEDRIFLAERNGDVSEWLLEGSRSVANGINLHARRLRIVHHHQGSAFCVRYDSMYRRCISVGADGFMITTEMSTGSVTSVRLSDHAVFSLTCAQNGLVITGDHQGLVRLIDRSAHVRVFSGHANAVRSVHSSPNCTWVATGSKDNTVRLWHVPSGRVWIVANTPDYVYEVAFSPDGTYLAWVDGAGELCVFSFQKPIDLYSAEKIDGLWANGAD